MSPKRLRGHLENGTKSRNGRPVLWRLECNRLAIQDLFPVMPQRSLSRESSVSPSRMAAQDMDSRETAAPDCLRYRLSTSDAPSDDRHRVIPVYVYRDALWFAYCAAMVEP